MMEAMWPLWKEVLTKPEFFFELGFSDFFLRISVVSSFSSFPVSVSSCLSDNGSKLPLKNEKNHKIYEKFQKRQKLQNLQKTQNLLKIAKIAKIAKFAKIAKIAKKHKICKKTQNLQKTKKLLNNSIFDRNGDFRKSDDHIMKPIAEHLFLFVLIQGNLQDIDEILLILDFQQISFRHSKHDSDFRGQSPEILIIDESKSQRVEMRPKRIDLGELEPIDGSLFRIEDFSIRD